MNTHKTKNIKKNTFHKKKCKNENPFLTFQVTKKTKNKGKFFFTNMVVRRDNTFQQPFLD